MRTVWVYSEQELSPRAFDVLQTIKNEQGFSDVQFKSIESGVITAKKILVFGTRKPEGIWNGVEFIHTYSVAQIMSKANAVTAVTAALRLYFGEKHEVPKGIVPIGAVLAQSPFRHAIRYNQPVVIDIETDGNLGKTHTPEEVNIISIAMYDGVGRPVVWAGKWNGFHTEPLDSTVIEMFRKELPKYEYAIYHNGKFDIRVLSRVLGVCLTNSFDTMLAHHVLNHAAGEHGLKPLAMRYLGAPDWEGDIKKYLKSGAYYELIPPDKLVEYNGWDVYWTWQLYQLFAPQIEADEDNETAFYLEMQAAEFLLDVEKNGIPFDSEAAKELEIEQEFVMTTARGQLRLVTRDENFNPNSAQQVKKYLNERFDLGVTTTNEDAITEILERTNIPGLKKFCTYLLMYRKASKIKGTYAKGWSEFARDDGTGQMRVHATYHVHGTSTGRLSSTQPNAQNMPRQKSIRRIVALTGD